MKVSGKGNKFLTDSNLEGQAIYNKEALPSATDDSAPGEYPFTRGIYPDMYRQRLWTMRQYSGFGTAHETNQRYRFLLDKGQTGLSTAFDLPTQMGYDSDHPLADGEVGKSGVAIDSILDMEVLLAGLPLDRITISMTINATAPILLALYIVVARRREVPLSRLRGTIQNDILKEYIARGTYIYPPVHSLRLITDVFKYCGENLPNWNTISISGYHIREAGANAVQELAFTFANAITYVEAAIESGLQIDDFASRLSFFFGCHNNFFEEIAKFRAGRRIWAKIMRERFQAQNPKSMMMRFHTQTCGSTLTAQQVENNVVRVTLQALSAVLGGTQSLHTNSKDEALALPTEASAHVALRTQQIVAYESGTSETVDPLGGSYFVESLTNAIEEGVWRYLQQVDELGGALAAIETKYFQSEIMKSAYDYQKQIEAGERVVVGVNEFVDEEATQPEILRVDPEIQVRQIQALKELRRDRDEAERVKALERLKTAASTSENLMPFIIDSVEAEATLGEISDVLRTVFGTHREG